MTKALRAGIMRRVKAGVMGNKLRRMIMKRVKEFKAKEAQDLIDKELAEKAE